MNRRPALAVALMVAAAVVLAGLGLILARVPQLKQDR